MAAHSIRRRIACIAVTAAIAGSLFAAPQLRAQLSSADLSSADVIRAALEQQTGKRVRLKLVSGQDLEGQVSRIGTNGVLLTELAGMEFYDATIRTDQIAAVIARRAR